MKTNQFLKGVKKGMIAVAMIYSGAALAQVPTTNLNGYWPMEGNAQDYSGNNNNGTITGAVVTTDRFNRANGAFEFLVNNSVPATIAVPSSATMQVTKPFTMSMWCMNYGKSMTIFRKGGDWGVDFGNATGGSFGEYLSIFAKKSNGTIDVKTTTTSFPLMTWMHIAIVFDNTTSNNLKLYINNTLTLTSTISNTSGSSTYPVSIGSYNAETFNGKLDEVRLYSRALNSAEITALYNDQPFITGLTVWDRSSTNGLVFCNNSSYTTTNFTINHTLPSGTNLQYYLVNSAGTSYPCGGQTVPASPAVVGWYIPSSVPAGTGYTLKIKSTNPVFEYTHPLPIDVYTQSTPVVSNTSPVSLCSGGSVTLNSSGSFSSTIYTWMLNNTEVTGYNHYAYPANLNVSNTGTYAAYYYDTDGCVVKSNSIVVTTAPSLTPSISGNTEICSGPATLSAGNGYTTYSWSNGATSQQIVTGPGTYSVTVTNSQGCSGTASVTVANSTACINLPCGASFDHMTAQIYASTPSMPASQIKNYIFRLYDMQNALVGSYTTTNNYFLLQDLPNIKYNTSYKWSAQIEFYTSTGTAFAPESVPCPMTMLPPATNVPCEVYYSGLNYNVSVTPPSTNSTISQIAAYKFTFYNMNGVPVANKTQGSSTLYFASVTGLHNNDDFMWSVQIQYVSGGTLVWGAESTPCLIMFGASYMKAQLDNKAIVSEESLSRTKCCDSLPDDWPRNASKLTIYPNPTSGESITVNFEMSESNVDLIITDLSGRIVITQKNISKNETVAVNELQKGLYIITIRSNNKSLSKKLIVE